MDTFHPEPGERVIRIVRKHWFVLLASLVPFVILAWIPTFVPGFVAGLAGANQAVVDSLAFLTPENKWFRLFLGVWWLMLWLGAYTAFTQYYLNHWIVTSLRVVRVRQFGFFSREVASFLLVRVQDVTVDVHGIFADLLGYGGVRVQTAGTDSKYFIISDIEDPQGMRDLIMSQTANAFKDNHTSHAAGLFTK